MTRGAIPVSCSRCGEDQHLVEGVGEREGVAA